jgi:hypothetical protein
MNLVRPCPALKMLHRYVQYGALSILVLFTSPASFSQGPASERVLTGPRLLTDSGSHNLRLNSFSARLKKEMVELDWVSGTQISASSHFVVQRSLDGDEFDDEALVFTEENPSPLQGYQYSDNISALNDGLIYYRLKLVDKNGRFRYSGTLAVRLGSAQLQTAVLIYQK